MSTFKAKRAKDHTWFSRGEEFRRCVACGASENMRLRHQKCPGGNAYPAMSKVIKRRAARLGVSDE